MRISNVQVCPERFHEISKHIKLTPAYLIKPKRIKRKKSFLKMDSYAARVVSKGMKLKLKSATKIVFVIYIFKNICLLYILLNQVVNLEFTSNSNSIGVKNFVKIFIVFKYLHRALKI